MPDFLSSKGVVLSAEGSRLAIVEQLAGADSWARRRQLLSTADLTLDEINCLMSLAVVCKQLLEERGRPLPVLGDKYIANLFYESSTRTRSSFELAARRLGATPLNLDIKSSSAVKGETLEDTAYALVSMGVDAVVLRHSSSGAADCLANVLPDNVCVINAGDGWHGHPTQALLDLFSMREVRPQMKGAKVVIVGDLLHSRVARCNIWLLQKLGVDVHVVGPPTLMPAPLASMGVTVHKHLEPAIKDADFIMVLRLQMERQQQGLIPSLDEYENVYRLDRGKLAHASKNVKVLHPGPVNRNIEITEDLVDDPEYSLVIRQITNGIAVRMAALYLLLSGAGGNSSDARKWK